MAIKSMAATNKMASENRLALRSEKGFTLVEMIVAVTLVLMMAVGMWSIFRTGIRSWSRGTEQIDAAQRHRNILDLVRKQMASAYPLMTPTDPDSPGPTYPIFYGTETSLSFISLNSLNFHKSPGLTLVNYDVIPGLQGNYSLVEREQRYLWELPDSADSIDLSSTVSLFDNLTECYFEYRKADSEDNSELWVREWDGEEMGQLPVAISMTMTSTDTNGTDRNRNIFVPIHAPESNQQTNTLNLSGIRSRGGMGRGLRLELEEAIQRGIGSNPGRGIRIDMGQAPRRGSPGMGPGGGPGMGPGGGPGGGPGMGAGRGAGRGRGQ